MRRHILAVLTACFGGSAVLLGAFGAHALADVLTPRQADIWETAVRFQFWHALALGLAATRPPGPWRGRAALGLCLGMVLFCGSLYALAAGAPRLLGMLTPLGGVLFVLGWVALGVALAGRRRVARGGREG